MEACQRCSTVTDGRKMRDVLLVVLDVVIGLLPPAFDAEDNIRTASESCCEAARNSGNSESGEALESTSECHNDISLKTNNGAPPEWQQLWSTLRRLADVLRCEFDSRKDPVGDVEFQEVDADESEDTAMVCCVRNELRKIEAFGASVKHLNEYVRKKKVKLCQNSDYVLCHDFNSSEANDSRLVGCNETNRESVWAAGDSVNRTEKDSPMGMEVLGCRNKLLIGDQDFEVERLKGELLVTRDEMNMKISALENELQIAKHAAAAKVTASNQKMKQLAFKFKIEARRRHMLRREVASYRATISEMLNLTTRASDNRETQPTISAEFESQAENENRSHRRLTNCASNRASNGKQEVCLNTRRSEFLAPNDSLSVAYERRKYNDANDTQHCSGSHGMLQKETNGINYQRRNNTVDVANNSYRESHDERRSSPSAIDAGEFSANLVQMFRVQSQTMFAQLDAAVDELCHKDRQIYELRQQLQDAARYSPPAACERSSWHTRLAALTCLPSTDSRSYRKYNRPSYPSLDVHSNSSIPTYNFNLVHRESVESTADDYRPMLPFPGSNHRFDPLSPRLPMGDAFKIMHRYDSPGIQKEMRRDIANFTATRSRLRGVDSPFGP